jgi:16S rRNA (guanine527-N7)-methyltransferase
MSAIAMQALGESAATLLDLRLSNRQRANFQTYAEELASWSKRFNLTAITDPLGIEIKHFLDSLSCLRALGQAPVGRLVDVGSGAGFPGIPLKIVSPKLEVTLIEATGKKADFCRHVIECLSLAGIEVEHTRAEDFGRVAGRRQSYDWAVARAVAPLPTLSEYLLPMLKVGGRAIALKGETGPSEAHEADEALRILGGRVSQLIPVELPGVAETRYLVVIDKLAATPAKYPRRSGMPLKRPLGVTRHPVS